MCEVKINEVIENYRKSKIQSEAEVSSKLICPLFRALGFPDENMSQEFPVYGYAGGNALNAKNADFIYFLDKDFAKHRTNTLTNKTWVQDNCLLIVEAKKPGEMKDDLGQAQFYASWTKSIAYVVTDGERFRAFYRSDSKSDLEVVDISVDEIPSTQKMSCLEFGYLKHIKVDSSPLSGFELQCVNAESATIITEDENLNLPEETVNYFKKCLGKNASGLSKVQVVSRFLNMTDCFLANDIRYDIPPYMIDIPRHTYRAHVYPDDSLFPLFSGTVTEYYRNDETRYFFESVYLEAAIVMVSDKVMSYEIGYHILDKTVDERIDNFKRVEKIIKSTILTIQIDDEHKTRVTLPESDDNRMWYRRNYMTEMFYFWLEGMYKLKDIEDYYEIKFNLKNVSDEKELKQLYEAIDVVHDGISQKQNCAVLISAESVNEDIEITELMIYEEHKRIPLKPQIIQGVSFKPYSVYLLPCKIKRKEQGVHSIPACCEYVVENG